MLLTLGEYMVTVANHGKYAVGPLGERTLPFLCIILIIIKMSNISIIKIGRKNRFQHSRTVIFPSSFRPFLGHLRVLDIPRVKKSNNNNTLCNCRLDGSEVFVRKN